MKAIEKNSEFNQLITQEKPIMLDFYADWCGPCQVLLPTVEKLSKEYGEEVEIRKVNVDQHRELASKFGVRSIPSLFFLKGNKVVDKANGVLPETELRRRLDGLINA